MKQKLISEGMREAAAIVRHGWCRKALHITPEDSKSGKHEYCAVGAMCKAGIWGVAHGSGVDALTSKRLFEAAICGQDIVQFNNRIAQSGEEVAQKFEIAAELAELEEAAQP